ncbi:hypothetical protein DFH11DRAFT_1245685 [Phellopilus nigrolimitatus]|nr:hypothetical protein DFH11DRAFT_1245685 [Phellopilus nigrolimitatus]
MSLSPMLTEFLNRDCCYDSLFDRCSPATLFRFGRTCQLARRALKDYSRRAYNINKHLSRFFTEPLEFRVLQAQTNAVVSGSTALQFMDRTLYEESDLDLYVTCPYAAQVCDWVIAYGGKGYVFDLSKSYGIEEGAIDNEVSNWNSYRWNRVTRVFNFKSTVPSGANVLKIQVIVTMSSPMDCMLGFHSTVVMNAITYRAAYALYPKGSFEEHRALVCDTKEVRHEQAIEKYKRRGWDIQTAISEDEQSDLLSAFRFENRWVADEKTWVIPFDIDGISEKNKCQSDGEHARTLARALPLSIDPFSLNSFSLFKAPENALVEMKFTLLKPDFFEHRYTACMDFSLKMSFMFHMIQCMKSNPDIAVFPESRKCDLAMASWKSICMRDCTCNMCGDEDERSGHARLSSCPAFSALFSLPGNLASSLFLEN